MRKHRRDQDPPAPRHQSLPADGEVVLHELDLRLCPGRGPEEKHDHIQSYQSQNQKIVFHFFTPLNGRLQSLNSKSFSQRRTERIGPERTSFLRSSPSACTLMEKSFSILLSFG